MRARKDRDADCAGPTNRVMAIPKTQNTTGPRSWSRKMHDPSPTSAPSDIRITRFGPTRSSRCPKAMVAIPATTLATTPKTITSPVVKPNTSFASTAP